MHYKHVLHLGRFASYAGRWTDFARHFHRLHKWHWGVSWDPTSAQVRILRNTRSEAWTSSPFSRGRSFTVMASPGLTKPPLVHAGVPQDPAPRFFVFPVGVNDSDILILVNVGTFFMISQFAARRKQNCSLQWAAPSSDVWIWIPPSMTTNVQARHSKMFRLSP